MQIPGTIAVRFFFVASLVLALAGCGGAGNGTSSTTAAPPPTSPAQGPAPSNSGDWINGSVADTFDAVRAAQIRSSARFRGADADLSGYGADQSHPYELARLDLVLSGGWTGAGQRVAVVDDGFRISHQEFTGTNIVSNGNIAPDGTSSHGTHVAALIAGSDDHGTMMGVAPDADLHLTSYLRDDTRTGLDLGKLARATTEAASLDVVAQNNSWGVRYSPSSGSARELLVSDVRDHMAVNGSTVPQAFSSLAGGTSPAWDNYFQALERFQSGGIVVWAMSNNENLSANDASSSLPLLIPQLKETWIAVGNGLFRTDSANEIVSAERLSSACGEMAGQCLFADGTTRSAGVQSDTAYGTGTGTSFAAPQVSGAVAIMAQAFPSLSPQEWTKRLLASAYSDFADFTADGTKDFGNGVRKSYSDEWGMGVLDIAAALSPIDGVSMVNGRSLSSATRSEPQASTISGGAASGDATRALMNNVEIAVFDSLNTPFVLSGDSFARTLEPVLSRAAPIPAFASQSLSDSVINTCADVRSLSASIGAGHYNIELSGLGGAQSLARTLGTGSATAATSSLPTLAEETAALSGQFDMGPVSLEHYSFAGAHASIDNGAMFGIGAGVSVDLAPATVKIAMIQATERGGMLGMTGGGHFSLPGDGTLSSVSISTRLDIGEDTSIFGGLERGVATGGPGGGYVASLGSLAFSSFQIGLRTEQLLDQGDSLSLTVSQPLRVESGTLELSVPSGRTLEGDIVMSQHSGTLEPTGRQVDFGLNYTLATNENAKLEIGAVYSLDLGHVSRNSGAALGATFTQKF